MFTNLNLTDMETCYKVIRRDVIVDLHVEAQRFDMEPEITARLIRRGHHILELPIAYEGRTHDDGNYGEHGEPEHGRPDRGGRFPASCQRPGDEQAEQHRNGKNENTYCERNPRTISPPRCPD